MKKKFLAVILSVIICIVGLTSAYAFPFESDYADVEIASELVTLYASTSPKATVTARSGFQMGEEIPAYKLNGNQLVPVSDVHFYPVYSGNLVYGIYTIAANGASEPTYSFSSDFANVLNELIEDGEEHFSVIYDSPSVYIKSESKTQVFLKSWGYRLDGQPFVFQDKSSIINNIVIQTSQLSGTGRSILPVLPQTRATRHTLPLDVWYQFGASDTTNLCWAGTIWAIGSYLTNDDSYTPESIADELGTGNNGVFLTEMPDIYDEIYFIDATLETNSGVLSPSTIADYIDSDTPIHGSWQGEGYGHSMAILGYQDDGMQICVMDTNIGDWKWMKNPSQDYLYVYDVDHQGTWKHSITF